MKRHYAFLSVFCVFMAIFSYGFIDPNLKLSHDPRFIQISGMLGNLVYRKMGTAAAIYTGILGAMFVGYAILLRHAVSDPKKKMSALIALPACILLFAYPAFSYDIFNYILTAKMTFVYRENPYVVMPTEIPNEPMLAYTRAANKVALYGPTWIGLSAIPYQLGKTGIYREILSFKIFAGLFYFGMLYLIYAVTKRTDQMVFFALNPLVLIEVLVSGHNDIVMMVLAIAGLMFIQSRRFSGIVTGWMLVLSSVFVKGATLILVPLLGLHGLSVERKLTAAFWLLFAVYLVSPIREEMYPWYAVWWISIAACIPMRKNSFIHGLCVWLSLGMMLRYVPWIATREYLGITPMVRNIATIVPVAVYLVLHYMRIGIRGK